MNDKIEMDRDDIKVIAASANQIIRVMRERMMETGSPRVTRHFRDVSIEAMTILKLTEPHLSTLVPNE